MNDIFTTHDIAKALSVNITTVMNWIDQGKLTAYRTPGKHRRVRKSDLLLFLRHYKMPVPDSLKSEHKLILVVDDEDSIRRFIRRTLKRLGDAVKIEEAADGFQAGKKTATLKPDLIILDVNLPGVSGLDLCRAIKSDPSLRMIRILAISGDASPANNQKMVDAGADIFMAKPLEVSGLIQTVNSLLELEDAPEKRA